ncbi:MAG TPA: hypothetical protein VKU83_10665, partial [Puia sp.]|nr:hypothetical protein [Puia sp.]
MKIAVVILILIWSSALKAQSIDRIVTTAAVNETESVLASDAMRGRGSLTPDIDRAADYIEARFHKAGLKTWNGSSSYRQPFALLRTTPLSSEATIDGAPLPANHVIAITSSTDLAVDENSGYKKVYIRSGGDFRAAARSYLHEKENLVVFVDTAYTASFPMLMRSARQGFKSDRSVIFILTNADPAHYTLHVRQDVK